MMVDNCADWQYWDLALLERVRNENVRAASDLEEKFLNDEEDFKTQQEAERLVLEARLARERAEFKEAQQRERGTADGEATDRLRAAEEFVEQLRQERGGEPHVHHMPVD